MDKEKMGKFISIQRKKMGYTQKELAEQLFVSNKAVSKWETGVSIPDVSLFLPLAELLGVTVTELLMGELAEKNEIMTPEQVESVITTAIIFTKEEEILFKQRKKRRSVLYIICLLVCAVENGVLYIQGAVNELVITYDILGILFGGYSCFFLKEKLPVYYDENKTACYSDGLFEISLPGIAINNKNWQNIRYVFHVWCIFMMIGYPFLWGIVWGLFCSYWSVIWDMGWFMVSLIGGLGGLFIPIYIAGKK